MTNGITRESQFVVSLWGIATIAGLIALICGGVVSAMTFVRSNDLDHISEQITGVSGKIGESMDIVETKIEGEASIRQGCDDALQGSIQALDKRTDQVMDSISQVEVSLAQQIERMETRLNQRIDRLDDRLEARSQGAD